MTRAEFLRRVAERSDPDRFLFLPEDRDRNPDGYCVIAHEDGGWEAYRYDRGKQDLRSFPTESDALEYAFRRWVLWDDV